MDDLMIAGRSFHSRLMVGSAKYPDLNTMQLAIDASGAEIVTVAIRRINLQNGCESSILKWLDSKRHFILPNTAGCHTAREAVLSAQLAREALQTNWVKLEVIGDDKTLFPDSVELLKAADLLVKDGFIVLPYCNDDPIFCRRLADAGCAAIMPLGAPIGSGLGIQNPYNLAILREKLTLPMIIDAGIGTASDAAFAMEIGADGVLVNTAIAEARNPILMAESIHYGVKAGRKAFLAGRIPKKFYGKASTSLEGRIACEAF